MTICSLCLHIFKGAKIDKIWAIYSTTDGKNSTESSKQLRITVFSHRKGSREKSCLRYFFSCSLSVSFLLMGQLFCLNFSLSTVEPWKYALICGGDIRHFQILVFIKYIIVILYDNKCTMKNKLELCSRI